jgi:Domain of unknown function (DUF1905)/TOBE domain
MVSEPRVRFEAVLQVPPGIAGTFVIVPDDVAERLEARGTTSVRGAINGVEWSGQVVRYRDDSPAGRRWYMVVNAAARVAARAKAGDTVVVELVRDDAPREIAVSSELQSLIGADPDDRDRWPGSPGHTGTSLRAGSRRQNKPRRARAARKT